MKCWCTKVASPNEKPKSVCIVCSLILAVIMSIFTRSLICFLVCLAASATVQAQTPPPAGIYTEDHLVYAFTGASLHISPGKTIENGLLLVQDEKILYAGAMKTVPEGSIVTDCKGKHIYPSFIDAFSDFGQPEVKRRTGRRDGPHPDSDKKGAFYWNQAIHPETHSVHTFTFSEEKSEDLLKSGFGMVCSHHPDGISRGSGTLYFLLNDPKKYTSKENTAQFFSYSKGSSPQDYPSSWTGSIALLRQLFYDLDWYKNGGQKKEENISLAALHNAWSLPFIMEARNVLEILKTTEIAKETGKSFIIKSAGDEYTYVEPLKATGCTLIVPLKFPAALKISDVYDAEMVSLEELKHWELAPYNPKILSEQRIPFALTASGTKGKVEFISNLRKSVRYGLPEDQAIEALTLMPARILGIEKETGSLEEKKWANFFITDQPFFEKESNITEHWVRGKKHLLKEDDTQPDFRGTYLLETPGIPYFSGKKMDITGNKMATGGKVHIGDSVKHALGIDIDRTFIDFHFYSPWEGGYVRANARLDSAGNLTGIIESPRSGKSILIAIKTAPADSTTAEKKEEKEEISLPGNSWFPNMAFGWDSLPQPQEILVKNATVWTNEAAGILQNTDVLIKNGKISRVGKGLSGGKEAVMIDGTGMHLTPGLIDEHSHIALKGGVNESGQAITAEVRMTDVVNPADINIFRQLAGGVTTSQLLHGSANPIGGQSALIKLKWGFSAQQMLFPGATPFIKFALGENVKQSNWGDINTSRYPQTRMGVEQLFYNAFYRALEYRQQQKNGEKPVRTDLELQALCEILDGKRQITCHSYVQSEILMLMRVADSMGFKINTFTHVLEGYKIAPELYKHGAGASTFSDWWAYKMEVMDAIPYNAALLTQAGVITAINSDDAEMGRRLNQEAAKSIKYGGLSEEEALKLVTLNPARLLRIDHRVGSIREGKDADVVLWSQNPLSTSSVVQFTIIDGIIFFDATQYDALLERNRKEKARLLDKMIKAGAGGEKTVPVIKKEQILYHCDTLEEE